MQKTANEEQLIREIRYALQGYQVARFTTQPRWDILDLPMFGIRFKVTDVPHEEDPYYNIISYFPDDELPFSQEDLFYLLAEKGYLHWLRNNINQQVYFRILGMRERWQKLVSIAIDRAVETRAGEYRISYLEGLLDRSLITFSSTPEIFDWILG